MMFIDFHSGPEGLIAALYDQLGFGNLIDELVTWDSRQCLLSPGTRIKALVINVLSSPAPLYMLNHYFGQMDTEHFFGKGAKPDYLKDYNLTRALDKVAEAGPERIFSTLSMQTFCREESFSACPRDAVDLEQAFLGSEMIHVVDSSVISSENLDQFSRFNLGLISRLPKGLSLENDLFERAWAKGMTNDLRSLSYNRKTYNFYEQSFKERLWGKDYSFIVVQNRKPEPPVEKVLQKEMMEKLRYLKKAVVKKMEKQSFESPQEALLFLQEFTESTRFDYFRTSGSVVSEEKRKPGRPSREDRRKPSFVYRLKISIVPDENAVEKIMARNSSFVLITNIQESCPEAILKEYLKQKSVGKIFRRFQGRLKSLPFFLRNKKRKKAMVFVLLTALLIITVMEIRVCYWLRLKNNSPAFSKEGSNISKGGEVLKGLRPFKTAANGSYRGKIIPWSGDVPFWLFKLAGVNPEAYYHKRYV